MKFSGYSVSGYVVPLPKLVLETLTTFFACITEVSRYVMLQKTSFPFVLVHA